MKLTIWAALGCASAALLAHDAPRQSPPFPQQNTPSLGITAALQKQSSGAQLLDLRPTSPQNLPIPNALRDAKSLRNNSEIIVVGDENAARKILAARLVGVVPAWTLRRETQLPRAWEISTAQLAAHAPKYQILDLRESDEWARSHIPNSRQVSMFEIEKVLSRNSNVALFCLTGHRSAFVVRQLRERGFRNVVSVRGGWLDWHAQKRTLQSE